MTDTRTLERLAVDIHRAALVATRMTTSTKQRLLIAFSSVLVGCAVGATMPRLAAQSFPPNPSAQRWEQFCQAADDEDVNPLLAARGSEGFELVSSEWEYGHDVWVCLKRPVAR